jgi:hypothetical protein
LIPGPKSFGVHGPTVPLSKGYTERKISDRVPQVRVEELYFIGLFPMIYKVVGVQY